MTRRHALVTMGALVGAACGLALWSLFTTHSLEAAVAVIGSLTAAYALVAAALTASPRSRQTVATSVACQAVLPGVELSAPAPVLVPAPRPGFELSN